MRFRKTDLVIILGAVAATLLLILALRVTTGADSGAAGEKSVRISVDGKTVGSYPLTEERDVPIETEHGHNLLRIRGGEVFMLEADCRDQYCVRQGKIRDGARTIICLPHRVVVEIIGSKDVEVDAVTG